MDKTFNVDGHGTQKLHNGMNILLQEAMHTDSHMLVLHPMISAHKIVKGNTSAIIQWEKIATKSCTGKTKGE